MLRYHLRQNLVLSLDLLLQVSDPLLVGGVVRSHLLLEGGRVVLEEPLLGAVEDRELQAEAHRRASRLAPSPADAASGRRPSPPVSSASVTFHAFSPLLTGGTPSPSRAEPEHGPLL